MSPDDGIHKGLDGVVVDRTAISMVNPETNSLTYRGYPVEQLAARCSFEEVAYLIWHGELPDAGELAEFVALERTRRALPEELFEVLGRLPTNCHPMDVLRTGLSYLGACDPGEGDSSPEANLSKALDMMAKVPSIVAFDRRRRRGQPPVAPDPELTFAENFFQMCFGEVPEPAIVECFEISLVLYAEHSFNASTFAARVVTSTLSDIYSAVVAAVGALKGQLHGGANEAVMRMLNEIGAPEHTLSWLGGALASHRLVMGFGHRVYKHGDSRVPTMRAALEKVAALRDGQSLLSTYAILERAMIEGKGIYPNLDFPSGPAYYLMGFDIEMFTPIFVMSRVTGWTAHVIEQLEANSLIRPLSAYVGLPRARGAAQRQSQRLPRRESPLGVVEEAAARLPAEPLLLDQPCEQWWRGEGLFGALGAHRLRAAQHRVEADEVAERERTEGVPAAEDHGRVDVLGGRVTGLEHPDRAEEVGDEEGVHDEAGAIVGVDDLLAEPTGDEGGHLSADSARSCAASSSARRAASPGRG